MMTDQEIAEAAARERVAALCNALEQVLTALDRLQGEAGGARGVTAQTTRLVGRALIDAPMTLMQSRGWVVTVATAEKEREARL